MKKRSIAFILTIIMMLSVLSNVLGLGVASAALRSEPVMLDPPDCDCGSSEIYLSKHIDGCDLKEYFGALAGCSVDEIGEYWNGVPYSARSYVLECIKSDDADKYAQAVAALAPYYCYVAQTPAGRSAMAAFDKVEDKLASLKEPTWNDLGIVYKAMEAAYARAFRNDTLNTSVLDLNMLDARFDAMEAYLLAVHKYTPFAANPDDVVMMNDSSEGRISTNVRYDSSVTAYKWISLNENNDLYLTLEGWVSGYAFDVSRPSDIVLVLDQSASMYTPVGLPFALWNYKKYEDNQENLERFGVASDDTLEGILNMLADPEVDENSKLTYAEKFAQLGYLVAQSRTGSLEYCTTEEHVHTGSEANICGIPAHTHTSECWANCLGNSKTYNIVSFHNSYYQWAYSVDVNNLYNSDYTNTNNIDKPGVHFKLYPIGENYYRVAAYSDKDNYKKVTEIRGTGSFIPWNAIAHTYISIINPTKDHPLMTLEIGDVVRINTNGVIDLSLPGSNPVDNGKYDAGGGSWAKGSVTIDIVADSYGVGAGWFQGNSGTVSTTEAFGANANPYQAFGYTDASISANYPSASKNVLGSADYRLTDGVIISDMGVNNLSDAGYVKFINTSGGKADAWIRLDYNKVYIDQTATDPGYALEMTRRFDTFTIYGFSGVGYGVPDTVRIYHYSTSEKAYKLLANTTLYYEYSNDHGYKVVVQLDDVVEAEDMIAIRITSKTTQLLIDEVEAAYCNRVPYNIVENDACYGSEDQFVTSNTFVEGSNTYYKTEFGNLHYYNYNAVNNPNYSTTLSTILTDGNKNVTEVGNAGGDGYLRFMNREGYENDVIDPYLIFDLGERSVDQRSRTYKIYGAGGNWGVVSPEVDSYRFDNIKIYVSDDQVNWTLVETTWSSEIAGEGASGNTKFDLWEVTYKSESFNYGRYVKFEFGECHHLWMSEIEIIRQYDANSDIDVRYYNRTGGNHQHDNACADCGLIQHEHTLQCGFNCPYETHTHEFCDMSCTEIHIHTDSCYTCGKAYHIHESKEFICTLTKQEIIDQHHVHSFDCYAGEGCMYCEVSHTHDDQCDKLATCGKVAHIHNVDCIGGKAGGCTLDEHTHDSVECYRTKECKSTFLSSGGHTAHTAECFSCGHVPHEHDYRCGISCYYMDGEVMRPQDEHVHSSSNSYDCWTYDWFVVQYEIGEDGVVGAMLNEDGTYTIDANSDDILKMYRIVTTSSPSQDSNAFTSLPQLEDNCLEIKLDELGKNHFYFYKSQTGALMDSLAMFLNSLNDSGMNHRVSVVGFASEKYSTEYAGGTGVYINGEFKSLIDTDSGFVELHRSYYNDYKALYNADPSTYPEYYAAQDAWAAAIAAGTDNPNIYSGDEPLSYRNLKKYTLEVYSEVVDEIISTGDGLITGQDYKDALMPLNPQMYQNVPYDSYTCFQNVLDSLLAVKTDYYYTNQYLGMYMASQIFENNPAMMEEVFDFDSDGDLDDLRQRMVIMFTDGVAQHNSMEPSNDAYEYQAYTIDKVLEYSRDMEEKYDASIYTICTSTVNISEYATEDVSYLYYSTSDFADNKETTDTDEAIYTVNQGKHEYPLTSENIAKLNQFMRVESSTQMLDAFNAVFADVGGAFAQISSNTIKQDVINDCFVLPDELVAIINIAKAEGKSCNSDNYPEIKDYIDVYTVNAIEGFTYTFPENTTGTSFSPDSDGVALYEDAKIEIGINQNGRYYVRVANFDYVANYVSDTGRDSDDDGTKDFWGKKLVTIIPIEESPDSIGGNYKDTNYSDPYGDDEYDFSGLFSYTYSVNGDIIGADMVAEFWPPAIDLPTFVDINVNILNGSDSDQITLNYVYSLFGEYINYDSDWGGNYISSIPESTNGSYLGSSGSVRVENTREGEMFILSVPESDLKAYDVEYVVYMRAYEDYYGETVVINGVEYYYYDTITEGECECYVDPGMLIQVNAVKMDVGANVKISHNFYVNDALVGTNVYRAVADVDVFKFAPYDTVVSVTTTSSKIVTLDASRFEVDLVASNVDLRLENGVYSFAVVDGKEYEIVIEYRTESVQDVIDGEVSVNQSASAVEGDGLYDVITTVTSIGNSRPVDIVFVVDVSDGMVSGSTDVKLAQTKSVIKDYISSSYALNSNVRVAIVAYADKYTMLTDGFATTLQDALNAVDRIQMATDKNGYAITSSNLQSGLYAARNLLNTDTIGAYTDIIVIKNSEPNCAYQKLDSVDAYNYSVVANVITAQANDAVQWELNRMSASRISQLDFNDITSLESTMSYVFDARNYINIDAGISITVNTDDFVLVESAGIFVDYNCDGVFSDSERLSSSEYSYVDGTITLHLGTLSDDVRIKHTLELKDKVSGDYFVSDMIMVNYYNAIKGIRETVYGVSPRVNYNKTTAGATITVIPYLAGEGPEYRPITNGGLTVNIAKEDAIIGEPIEYKVSGVTNLTAGNAYTVKAPVMAGYTLWEGVDATQIVIIPSEGGDFVVYFPYYESGALVDDSVVYDESAPTVFDVLSNDKQPGGESFDAIYGIGIDKNIAKGSISVETDYGMLEVVGGKLKYTTKGVKEVTEVFYYSVKDSAGNIRVGTIYVVPATIVKVDSSSALIEHGDRWQVVDNDRNVVSGDYNDYVSNKSPNDADDVYGGSDDSYTGKFKFDAGYALYANRYQDYINNGEVDGLNAQYTVSFTFEGTGFDVISVTGLYGGYATIKTYDEKGNIVPKASGNVLTYSNNPDIYQATVFTCTDLTHGKYTVEIVALKTIIDRIGMSDAQVFVDSVRVYNPFTGNTNIHYNDTHDETVTNTLRDVFANGKLAIGDLGDGMFTLSGYLDIDDFISKGTNNAININGGQSLLLTLDNASALTTFQVEMAAFQSEAVVKVVVNNEEVETIVLNTAIFAYYDLSKYIRENSTVKFEVVSGNVTFSNVRYKNAQLGVPSEGDKYVTGDFIQNGTAPEIEWMSDEYRINSVYILHNKKEGTRTVTVIAHTSINADTVVAYTNGYRITPTSKTYKVGEHQTAFVLSYVIPELDTAGEAITGEIQIDFYAYDSVAHAYSSTPKAKTYTMK